MRLNESQGKIQVLMHGMLGWLRPGLHPPGFCCPALCPLESWQGLGQSRAPCSCYGTQCIHTRNCMFWMDALPSVELFADHNRLLPELGPTPCGCGGRLVAGGKLGHIALPGDLALCIETLPPP